MISTDLKVVVTLSFLGSFKLASRALAGDAIKAYHAYVIDVLAG